MPTPAPDRRTNHDVHDRLKVLEAALEANTTLTKETAAKLEVVSADISGMIALFKSLESGFNVLVTLGKIAKWLAPILAVAAYIWAYTTGRDIPVGK